MPGTSLGFVLIAAFLHTFWNTLAKKSPRKITFVWWFILFLSMFNQRKLVIVISDKSDVIAKGIMDKIQRGVTLLYGRGGYTGRRKKVLLTVVNNYQLKRVEEVVFSIDLDAFFITDNTFNVIGRGFSRRKVY